MRYMDMSPFHRSLFITVGLNRYRYAPKRDHFYGRLTDEITIKFFIIRSANC